MDWLVNNWLVNNWLVNNWLMDNWVVNNWLVNNWFVNNWLVNNWLVNNWLVNNGLVNNGLVDNWLVYNWLVNNWLVNNGLVDNYFLDDNWFLHGLVCSNFNLSHNWFVDSVGNFLVDNYGLVWFSVFLWCQFVEKLANEFLCLLCHFLCCSFDDLDDLLGWFSCFDVRLENNFLRDNWFDNNFLRDNWFNNNWFDNNFYWFWCWFLVFVVMPLFVVCFVFDDFDLANNDGFSDFPDSKLATNDFWASDPQDNLLLWCSFLLQDDLLRDDLFRNHLFRGDFLEDFLGRNEFHVVSPSRRIFHFSFFICNRFVVVHRFVVLVIFRLISDSCRLFVGVGE